MSSYEPLRVVSPVLLRQVAAAATDQSWPHQPWEEKEGRTLFSIGKTDPLTRGHNDRAKRIASVIFIGAAAAA